MRIGTGWDRHKLVGGRDCRLGGVHFPESDVGPLGHSDGDAVLHAVIDALLGAAAMGDIGSHFPDTDPLWRDADSGRMLADVCELLSGRGLRIANVDLTIILEAPRIAPRVNEMRQTMSGLMEIDIARISVKATRGEGLGPEGRGECVTVTAVALLSETGVDG